MSLLSRNFPNRHAIMLLITLMQLGAIGVLDVLLIDGFPWLDLLWLLPILFAAITLTPVEVIAVALGGSMMCLTALATTGDDFSIWPSATIATAGLMAAVGSMSTRRYLQRFNIARNALERSPLAYAEFRFPGYSLVNSNRAFEEMSAMTMAAPGTVNSLFGAFPKDTALRVANHMDMMLASGSTEADTQEFCISTSDGGATFWRIDFIPIPLSKKGRPRTVALFAFEVTDAVTRARTREAALKFSVSAMSRLELEETVWTVMEGLAHITGVDAAALFLLDEDQWVGKAGYGTHVSGLIEGMRFPYEAIASAREAVERKIVIAVEDVSLDERFSMEQIKKLNVKSAMVVPLVSANRAVGVVFLSRMNEIQAFTEDQVKFATIIGSHAALAIENSLIYQQEHSMRQSLEAIEAVSEAGLVSLDLDKVLAELVNRTQDVMQMDAAMVLLYDGTEQLLVGRAVTGDATGAPPSHTRLKVGEGIAGRAFAEGAPMKIDDIRGNQEVMCPLDECETGECPFSEQSGIMSVLAVPLRSSGHIIGVLQIGSKHAAAFSAGEWGLIQVLADRASLAVQNSMLHEKTARELARLTVLREVADACAGHDNMEVIAQKALEAIYQQLGCSIASVYYLDQEQEMLVNLASIGHPAEVMKEYRTSNLDRGTLLTRSVHERRIITHEEVNLDNATETEAEILRMLDIGYNRCARIPIIYQNEPVGAMALVFPDTRPFQQGSLDTLKSISHMLAIAFKNYSESVQNVLDSV